MSIQEILETKYPSAFLTGFRNGWLDPSNTKLFAYSVMPAQEEAFRGYLFSIKGYSYDAPSITHESLTISLEGGCYSCKELDQLIDEGAFKWCCIKFYGIFFQDQWCLTTNYVFYDDITEGEIVKKTEEGFYKEKDFWMMDYYFTNVPEFSLEVDFKALSEKIALEYNEVVDLLKDTEKMTSYMKILGRENIPKNKKPQFPQYRQFVGQPWLVAMQKGEEKNKINSAYERYISQEIFMPLAKSLKVAFPDEFYRIGALPFQAEFRFIYPHSKEQVIGIIEVFDREENSRLYYFLFKPDEKKIFQWTLPSPRWYHKYHRNTILEDIEKLSDWGRDFDIHEPSITMDDQHFWEEYVFKKEGDNYCYLKPVELENLQKDVFTQW